MKLVANVGYVTIVRSREDQARLELFLTRRDGMLALSGVSIAEYLLVVFDSGIDAEDLVCNQGLAWVDHLYAI